MLSYNIASKQANKDEGQSTAGGGGGNGSGGRKASSLKPPEQILKCPRCDSPNTKFCYYNNYSLAQPRHFCKACRRYWTKGGALRSVPIGGSCRKNKKTKSCSSRFFIGESSSKGSSSDIGGMNYGVSTLDFNLGGLSYPPRVTTNNQFSSSYVDTSSNPNSFVSLDPLGFHLPFSSSHTLMKQGDHQHQQQLQHNQTGGRLASLHEIPTYNHLHHHHNTDLASSIESLSSINQDLHWKLQQQRLAMLFGGGGDKESDHHQQQQKKQLVDFEAPAQKLQPILFQNLEISKPVQSFIDGEHPRKDHLGTGASGLATEWFFDSSYAPSNLNPEASTNSNSAGNDQNGSINHWNGIQNWNHLN